jgi:hypothetical protein
MMIQTFIVMIAFSVALLAFCAGSALTAWATSSSHIGDVAAAKLSGYFVMVLAVVALVCSSYYVAMGMLNGNSNPQPMSGHWSSKSMQQHPMHKSQTNKDSKSNRQ